MISITWNNPKNPESAEWRRIERPPKTVTYAKWVTEKEHERLKSLWLGFEVWNLKETDTERREKAKGCVWVRKEKTEKVEMIITRRMKEQWVPHTVSLSLTPNNKLFLLTTPPTTYYYSFSSFLCNVMAKKEGKKIMYCAQH